MKRYNWVIKVTDEVSQKSFDGAGASSRVFFLLPWEHPAGGALSGKNLFTKNVFICIKGKIFTDPAQARHTIDKGLIDKTLTKPYDHLRSLAGHGFTGGSSMELDLFPPFLRRP